MKRLILVLFGITLLLSPAYAEKEDTKSIASGIQVQQASGLEDSENEKPKKKKTKKSKKSKKIKKQ